MIAVDTNILVYAHRFDSVWNERAYGCLQSLAEGGQRWAIPWSCLHEFLAIVTHPRIYDPPTPLEQALAQVEAWTSSPSVSLIHEGPDHMQILAEMVQSATATGPRIHDARVAAICVGAGATELWTADRDFSRYHVSTRNPLLTN